MAPTLELPARITTSIQKAGAHPGGTRPNGGDIRSDTAPSFSQTRRARDLIVASEKDTPREWNLLRAEEKVYMSHNGFKALLACHFQPACAVFSGKDQQPTSEPKKIWTISSG